jgi:hypothetical protein
MDTPTPKCNSYRDIDKSQLTDHPRVDELNYKHCRFAAPFRIYSAILRGWIYFPIGFIDDHESEGMIKGTSNRGGHGHDLLCRRNAIDFIEFDDPETAITKITKKMNGDSGK